MSVFAVTYSYGGPAEVLARHRPRHRSYLRELAARGVVLASGPFTDDGPAGALLLLSADDAEQVRALLAEDPLMVHGAISEHTVREWDVTNGSVG